MTHETLKRYRDGLQDGRWTLTEVQRVTNIPLTTLWDMRDPQWCAKQLQRLAELEAGLARLSQSASADT